MKRIILSVIILAGSISFAPAQEKEKSHNPAVNRHGISYLPEAGDFALGVDAAPFLNYLGNMFNDSKKNKAPEFENGLGIYGKYFIEDNQAIRAKLNVNFSTAGYKQTVPNDHELLVNPTNHGATVVDTRKDVENVLLLSLGYEFRRGKGRLQGFYGADILLGYENGRSTYKYSNPVTAANQSPSTADFAGGVIHPDIRTLVEKDGYNFAAGLGAFVGVEYFITPLISLGGEFNLNFLYQIAGQSETTFERFLGSGVEEYTVRQRTVSEEDNPAFRAGLFTKPAGSLFVMFHF
ncbi:MAG: hypothetical protein LBJ17_03850 [Dysgonamonadaceae bacterium]|jgi:hypothetical protein|nr:hypothetical protein [Dysgonamonadaceae bacterium]